MEDFHDLELRKLRGETSSMALVNRNQDSKLGSQKEQSKRLLQSAKPTTSGPRKSGLLNRGGSEVGITIVGCSCDHLYPETTSLQRPLGPCRFTVQANVSGV